MIPSSILALDVKARADFVAIVSRYTRLRRAGRQFVGLCPFHRERHPSFYIHPEKKIFHCFGCGAGGDLFDFVMKAECCDFREALRIVSNFSGSSEARPAKRAAAKRRGLPPGLAVFARPTHIGGKTEVRARSFSPANRWPSVEDCAAERAAEAERGEFGMGVAFFTCTQRISRAGEAVNAGGGYCGEHR